MTHLYKSGFDPTVNVRIRHSFNGGHYGRGGLDVVKDASQKGVQHRSTRQTRRSREEWQAVISSASA